MTTVHKFPLAAIPDVELMMPAGARLLHVGHQDGALMLWAEAAARCARRFRMWIDPEDEQLAEMLEEAGIGKGESNEG